MNIFVIVAVVVAVSSVAGDVGVTGRDDDDVIFIAFSRAVEGNDIGSSAFAAVKIFVQRFLVQLSSLSIAFICF